MLESYAAHGFEMVDMRHLPLSGVSASCGRSRLGRESVKRPVLGPCTVTALGKSRFGEVRGYSVLSVSFCSFCVSLTLGLSAPACA